MARTLDELVIEAGHARLAGKTEIVVNQAELKMLKDYGLARGTADKDKAEGDGTLFNLTLIVKELGR